MSAVARRLPEIFVAAVFLALLATDAVLASGVRDVPHWDLWNWIPWLTGRQPVDAAWIWSQHSEHRMPAARLVHLAIARLAHGDLRIATWIMLASIAGSVAALVLALRRARGRTDYLDAVVPVALMHPGHAEGFLWTFDLTMAMAAATFAAVLAVVVVSRDGLTRTGAAVAGAGVVTMPLWGSQGLIAAPALAIWLAVAGWRSSPGARAIAWTGSATALAVAAAWVVGIEVPFLYPGERTTYAVARCASEVLATAIGTAGAHGWPVSAALVGVVATGGLVAGVRKLRLPDERLRAFGLATAFVAVVATVAITGFGRANFPRGTGLGMRYVVTTAPLLVIAYLLASPPRAGAFGRCVAFAAFTLACAALSTNVEAGSQWASQRRREADAFVRDALADVPIGELSRRHAGTLFSGNVPQFTEFARALREADMGPFRLSSEERVRRIGRLAWDARTDLPMFPRPPAAIRSAANPRRVAVGGVVAIEIDPPAELRYGVLPGRYHVTGRYDGPAPLHAALRDPGRGGERAVAVETASAEPGALVPFAFDLDAPSAALLVLRPESNPERKPARFTGIDLQRS
ncbi:MAG TPA: hypothetical protein VKE69_09590 [Planctomycetota bacterium]|nr:hypothetical protein [Planctomycetota bacterium]